MLEQTQIKRLRELYENGGLSRVKRGITDYILTSNIIKRIRETVTLMMGGVSIWEKDWDVLLILDGCRVDIFKQIFDDTESVTSVATTSRTWIKRTFNNNEYLNNVGYITANPFYTEADTDRLGYFHAEGVVETDYGIETVPPRTLAEHAIDVWRRRQTIGIDQLVIHFMQPHTPFRSRPEWFECAVGENRFSGDFWRRFRNGGFERDNVWSAYQDNLEWVVDEAVDPMRQNIEGQIALSADHGNLLGEYGIYGHPVGFPITAVREVPWKTLDGVDEGTIQPEQVSVSNTIDTESQLKALGYK
jgi:hypothetical protein